MSNGKAVKIGELSMDVVKILGLSIKPGTPIYLGQSNISHMQNRHPEDYAKYGSYIREIISTPDYVGINPSDDSIEYTKDFKADNDYVKVAVRVSLSGTYFARSLFTRNRAKIERFIASGKLKPLTTRTSIAHNINGEDNLEDLEDGTGGRRPS